MIRLALLASSSATIAACAIPAASIRYDFTRTTTAPAAARPAGCQIELFTTPPAKPFVELGSLDWHRRGFSARAYNAADFMRAVQPQVCGAGGSAVLAEVGGDGAYVRGTVIRFATAEAPAPELKEWP